MPDKIRGRLCVRVSVSGGRGTILPSTRQEVREVWTGTGGGEDTDNTVSTKAADRKEQVRLSRVRVLLGKRQRRETASQEAHIT